MYPERSDPLVPVPAMPALEPDAPMTRGRALAEVVLCSGFPTQLAIAGGLASVGLGPGPGPDGLTPSFLFALTGLDTLILLGLIVALLRRSNDSPRALLLGQRPVPREALLGVLLVPAVFLFVIATQVTLRLVAPWLHNVPVSPFQSLFESPGLLAGFVILVLVGGGVREEVQRAFLLHRFEQRLGGARVGLVVTSVAFGVGHTVQGWDAAIITGVLGAFWGAAYLARRSVVAPVCSHALFNVAQIALSYAITIEAARTSLAP